MKNSKTLLGICLLVLAFVLSGLVFIKSDVTIAQQIDVSKKTDQQIDISKNIDQKIDILEKTDQHIEDSEKIDQHIEDSEKTDQHIEDSEKTDQQIEFSSFSYSGIENRQETVYNLNFSDKNIMEVTGGEFNVFHVSQIPVVINGSKQLGKEKNEIDGDSANILGGDGVRIESDNVTVIGGYRGRISDSNSTFFGGVSNKIDSGYEGSHIPSILFGGADNTINSEHDASVIMGGDASVIGTGSKNVNILGGDKIVVSGTNVIAGGQNIKLKDIKNSFIFNGSSEEFSYDVPLNGVFYLNVDNGVGFGTGTYTGNQGVVSQGAVNLGKVDVKGCKKEKIGMVGTFQGCLLGCTEKSSRQGKWELLDYGLDCKNICARYDNICVEIQEDEPEDEYPSFCVGKVQMDNTTRCNNTGLELYYNVVFETYLIDSSENCPNNAINQCAYKCNIGTHLTGDQTGRGGGITMCFKDCPLPWDSNETRKHNEVIEAYSRGSTSCLTEESCESYKGKLMCVDGDWRVIGGNGEISDLNSEYIFKSCVEGGSNCQDEGYTLTRKDIVDNLGDWIWDWRYGELLGETQMSLIEFLDGNLVPGKIFRYDEIRWKEEDPKPTAGMQQKGVRGLYSLCIQYNLSEEGKCEENGPFPNQYRYKLEKCMKGYDLSKEGKRSVCRKECSVGKDSIKHGSGINFYTGNSVACPNECKGMYYQCYDGTLYTGLKLNENGEFIEGKPYDGQKRFTSCALTGNICSGYNINQQTYESMKDKGTFTPCTGYSVANKTLGGKEHKQDVNKVQGDKVQLDKPDEPLCKELGVMYRLESCNANYYRSGDTCVACPTGYNSNTGSTQLSDCKITCLSGTHVKYQSQQCISCGTGEYKNLHTISAPQMSICSGCTNLPSEHAHYTSVGTGGPASCAWECDEGYTKVGNQCVESSSQCDISDFEDLDMYFITDTGTTGHYTLMDRNLGATAYMDEAGKTTGDWNGCLYQWGNNYGFSNTGDVKTSNILVNNALSYGPNNPYSSDTFIIDLTLANKDWTSDHNNNLWGDTEDTLEARQGPCPTNYHVPTKDEFVDIVDNYWKKSENNANISSNQWNLNSHQRSLDSLMPFAGERNGNGVIIWLNPGGEYRSSSSYPGSVNVSYNLNFFWNSVDTHNVRPQAYSYRINGKSVRCFKNYENSLLTIDAKGGTGALIIVHGGEITKLGTPHKGTSSFLGWYWNDGYTLKAKTGDTVSSSAHLYAKWETPAQCGTTSGGSYVTLSNSSAGLCNLGSVVGTFSQSDTGFTWTCTNGGNTVNCGATRKYSCEGSLPSGSGVSMGDITRPYEYAPESWTYSAEGDLGACQWRCNEGYVSGANNTCVEGVAECGSANGGSYLYLEQVSPSLCSGSVAQNLHSTDTEFLWTCTTGSSTVGCSANKLISDFECLGDDYSVHAELVNQAIAPGQYKRLFRTLAEAQATGCSYVCTGGYEYLPNPDRCVMCEAGSQHRVNGVLVGCTEIVDVCPDPDEYALVDGRCVAYGYCTRDASYGHPSVFDINAFINRPWYPPTDFTTLTAYVVTTGLTVARPIGGNIILPLTCVHNIEDIVPNSCQYSCNDSSYGCVERSSSSLTKQGENVGFMNVPMCGKRSCSDGNSVNREAAVKSEDPVWYKEYRKYLPSNDTEHFYQQVENMSGCYFWCPTNHLCDGDHPYYDGTDGIHIVGDFHAGYPMFAQRDLHCYSSEEERDAHCGNGSSSSSSSSTSSDYVCNYEGVPRLLGYVSYNLSSNGLDSDRDLVTYYEPGAYENSDKKCYQGCTSNATGVIAGPNGETVCWRQCSENQIFDISLGGGCKPCDDEAYRPSTGDEYMWAGNSLACVKKCEDGRTYRYGQNRCILESTDPGECPSWAQQTSIGSNQIECYYSL